MIDPNELVCLQCRKPDGQDDLQKVCLCIAPSRAWDIKEIADLTAENARLKERRVHWQDLTYAAMNAIDSAIGGKTTEDTFKDDCRKLTRIRQPFAKVIDPITNRRGFRCGTCDGTDKHEHGCVECSRCGKQGLRENWPFGCCIDAHESKTLASDIMTDRAIHEEIMTKWKATVQENAKLADERDSEARKAWEACRDADAVRGHSKKLHGQIATLTARVAEVEARITNARETAELIIDPTERDRMVEALDANTAEDDS